MATVTAERLYQQYIRPIPAQEQLQLIVLIGQQLATQSTSLEKKRRSLLEFEGLGAELWKGIDAGEYVDQLRQEWEMN